MEIKLRSLIIKSFKGIKSFGFNPNGKNSIITAENGSGKTTVQDAFYWLFFDKDSTGRKQFELRPLDKQNRPIKGLTLEVDAELSIDGDIHVFTKKHVEKIVKGVIKGFTSEYYIDEVPKKAGEYAAYIKELIAEDTFKLLTDLTHFNGKMHWQDRRKVLLDIAGEIGSPGGFDKLTDELNGRSIEDYKKVLASQKSKLKKDQDGINPRIDELQRGLNDYAGTDRGLEGKRSDVQSKIDDLDTNRKALLEQETTRQESIAKLNKFEAAKITREAELKSDTSAVQVHYIKLVGLEKALADKKRLLANIECNKGIRQTEIKAIDTQIKTQTATTKNIADEYNNTKNHTEDSTCYACGQDLPAEKLEEIESKRKEKLTEISNRGRESKDLVDKLRVEREQLLADLQRIKEAHAKVLSDAQYQEESNADQIALLQEKIDNNEGLPKDKDDVWQAICQNIITIKSKIGDPVSNQLAAIETTRKGLSEQLNKLNTSLAQADTMEKNAKRIKELEQQEIEIGQKIADIEGKLSMIGDYKKAESALIESSVNKKFKHVTFKLFNVLLNGEIEDTCVAIYKGTPYPDMSTGEKIFVGIDIMNVLSAHYGILAPLFIDHMESLTMPIGATCQTIGLFAKKGIEELTVKAA